ncbi:MAG: hypothetical protein K2X81_08790 [Candidatus Obscuribacterales bacterium]|nr:hypothetical protein [Candidatus Obscuribacterales bacterium]
MKRLKRMLPLLATLTFVLPALACGGDESTNHPDCDMQKHKQHDKKDQKSSDAKGKQTETDRQQEKSEGEQDKNHVH